MGKRMKVRRRIEIKNNLYSFPHSAELAEYRAADRLYTEK